MTANEKAIRKDWQEFIKSKQKQDKVIYVKKEDISKIFSKMF